MNVFLFSLPLVAFRARRLPVGILPPLYLPTSPGTTVFRSTETRSSWLPPNPIFLSRIDFFQQQKSFSFEREENSIAGEKHFLFGRCLTAWAMRNLVLQTDCRLCFYPYRSCLDPLRYAPPTFQDLRFR